MKDDISNIEKARRKKYLNDKVVSVTALKNNQKLLGTKQKILIEKINKDFGFGKTLGFKDVIFKLNKNIRINTFVELYINKATPWSLKGDLIN